MTQLLPDNVERYWQKHSWNREVFESSHLRDKFLHQRELLVECVRRRGPTDVLVLCCGFGLESADIAGLPSVKKVVAVDINPDSCRSTRERTPAKVEVLNQNVYDLDYADRFDAVVCLDALHHLGDQDKILGVVRRALRTGGLFAGDYFGKELFQPWMIRKHGRIKAARFNAKHHVARFLLFLRVLPTTLVERGWMRAFLLTREQVRDRLTRAGFVVEDIVSDEWHFFEARKP